MARFRYRPALPDLPKGAERAIVAQFKAVEVDLDAIRGVQANSPPVITERAYAAHEGELVRISPPAGGQLITIPPGRPENISQKIRIALVGGTLSPGATVSIIGGQGTINGAATLTLTTRGMYELHSVGAPGWVCFASTGGGGGLPPDADYGDITVSGAGTVWTVDPGAVAVGDLANIADETFVGNVSGGAAPPSANNLSSLAGTGLTWNAALNRFDVSGGSGFTLSTVEVNLGSGGVSGSFTIVGAGLTPGRPVLCVQAVGPYTGKGSLEDVAEEPVWCTAVVTSAVLITVYWQSSRPVGGNVKFNYAVG